MVSVASQKFSGFFFLVPLKITSSILVDLKVEAFCSPSTHLIASTIFVLPQPFGPTIEVTPSVKLSSVLSGNDLNP